jgi:acyl-CoA thioester hydrolase
VEDALNITVPFRDVDMHGHVHNAVHLMYFEAAISHFLRKHGLSDHFNPHGALAYHVRKAEVVFHAPTRYEDHVIVRCAPAVIGRSSLRFAGRLSGADAGDLRATAEIVWVCVDTITGETAPVPDPIRQTLSPFLIATHQAE